MAPYNLDPTEKKKMLNPDGSSSFTWMIYNETVINRKQCRKKRSKNCMLIGVVDNGYVFHEVTQKSKFVVTYTLNTYFMGSFELSLLHHLLEASW